MTRGVDLPEGSLIYRTADGWTAEMYVDVPAGQLTYAHISKLKLEASGKDLDQVIIDLHNKLAEYNLFVLDPVQRLEQEIPLSPAAKNVRFVHLSSPEMVKGKPQPIPDDLDIEDLTTGEEINETK